MCCIKHLAADFAHKHSPENRLVLMGCGASSPAASPAVPPAPLAHPHYKMTCSSALSVSLSVSACLFTSISLCFYLSACFVASLSLCPAVPSPPLSLTLSFSTRSLCTFLFYVLIILCFSQLILCFLRAHSPPSHSAHSPSALFHSECSYYIPRPLEPRSAWLSLSLNQFLSAFSIRCSVRCAICFYVF